MGYSNGFITPPVSIYDVQRALGTSENDVGRLCQHANINMWSRHKPVGYRSIKPIGFGDSDPTNEAKTVGYGLAPGAIKIGGSSFNESDVTDMFEDETGQYDWKYTKPAGGQSQPFRLTDFAGYYDGAMPFIVSEMGTSIVVNRAKSSQLYLHVTSDPGNSQYNLQTYDFDGANIDLSKWYLGALINGLRYRNDVPVTDPDSGSFVLVNLTSSMDGKTYPLYMFLHRFNESTGLFEYMKMPASGPYNRFPVTLSVYFDNSGAGGGIPESRQNVWLLPDYGLDSLGWKLLDNCCEDSDAMTKYRFQNTSGNLFMKVKMVNTSTDVGHFQSGNFKVFNVESGVECTPEMMLVSSDDTTYQQVNNFNIPAKSGSAPGVMYVKLLFTQYDGTPIMKGTAGAEEVAFSINGHQEFYDTIYYLRGTPGFVLQ